MAVGLLSLCRPLGLLVLSKGSWVTGPCGVVEQVHHILISLSDYLPSDARETPESCDDATRASWSLTGQFLGSFSGN